MAERKVSGKDILLFIDPNGGTDYKTIVCLTSNSIKRATALITAATKCGPDSSPGEKTINVDFSGTIVVDPDLGHIAQANLHQLWQDDTIVGWKMGKAIPIAGDVTYSGTAFIATLDDTYDMSGATFAGTLGIQGNITQVIEGIS